MVSGRQVIGQSLPPTGTYFFTVDKLTITICRRKKKHNKGNQAMLILSVLIISSTNFRLFWPCPEKNIIPFTQVGVKRRL